MKYALLLVLAASSVFTLKAQDNKPPEDKTKRPSPPAVVKQTITGGATVTIDYSQPSVKGRTIGTDLEPKAGQVWRTGANEATVLEVSQAVKLEGQGLSAGKYGLFTILNGTEWTIIVNKTWNQWGAYDYKQADDVFRVKVKDMKAASFAEKMTFTVSPAGLVTLVWGNHKVEFHIN